MMKDMLGVIEADCLEPTHNKQAFKESDMAYHRMKKRHAVYERLLLWRAEFTLGGKNGRGASSEKR